MTATPETATGTRATFVARFASFIAERHPFAAKVAVRAFEESEGNPDRLRAALREALAIGIEIPDTTPGVSAQQRFDHAIREVLDACDGFLRREAIAASLSADEKREILRGMLLTRATDNR